jgi:hypothetical protein
MNGRPRRLSWRPQTLELDEDQDVQPLQRDRLDGEEVDREHALAVCSQEGTPREPGPFAGRAKPCLPQDLPHRRGRDADAEAVQFAGDPLVAPARILAREPDHQLPDLAANRRPPAATAVRPAVGGEPAVPAQERRCVTKKDRQLDLDNSRLAAARSRRSVIVNCGRCVCRRNTESSCRSTTISSSLKSRERGHRNTSCSTQRTSR